MSLFETKNSIRQKDLEELAREEIFDSFKNQTILVTGATGLLGSEIVLALLCANRLKNLNIKVVALLRNIQKAQKVFSNVIDNPFLEIVEQDINDSIQYRGNVDYIVHAANITASKDIVSQPVETAQTTVNGTLNILEFAHEKKVKSFLYLSSIEIYGQTDENNADIKENHYGILDPLKMRNVYPLSKKLAENICISYCAEYGINTKIARLTQTFGAGISDDESRVFAQFAKSVVEKRDIVLHTDGLSYKNYCYLTDAVSAMLTILLKGENSQAYNVAEYTSAISVKDMAEMLARKYKLKVKFDFSANDRGYNDKVVLKLNTEKLERLGWRAKIRLEQMYERLIDSLEDTVK